MGKEGCGKGFKLLGKGRISQAKAVPPFPHSNPAAGQWLGEQFPERGEFRFRVSFRASDTTFDECPKVVRGRATESQRSWLAELSTSGVNAADPNSIPKHSIVNKPFPCHEEMTPLEIALLTDIAHLRKKRQNAQGFQDRNRVSRWKLFKTSHAVSVPLISSINDCDPGRPGFDAWLPRA